MSETTFNDPSAAQLPVCAECGREAKHLKRKMCGTCYMRVWRGGGVALREPLDPEIAALLLPVPGTSASFAERVFTYVDASGDCWEWTGTKDDGGYGVIGRGGRGSGNMPAHCAVWSLLVGPILPGLQYDHLCRNHGCVSPAHGDPVPAKINKERGFSPAVLYAKRATCGFGHPLDGRTRNSKSGKTIRYCKTCKREKMRASRIPKGPKTCCKNGHEFTPASTYIDKRGRRNCKICKIERQRAARAVGRERVSEAA